MDLVSLYKKILMHHDIGLLFPHTEKILQFYIMSILPFNYFKLFLPNFTMYLILYFKIVCMISSVFFKYDSILYFTDSNEGFHKRIFKYFCEMDIFEYCRLSTNTCLEDGRKENSQFRPMNFRNKLALESR